MILKKVRFKNFFSSGNEFIEIDILKHKKSVISGSNGNGKSTIANAVTFGLFGKTIKKVTKAQIINSINNKACLVEIELDSGGSSFLIRRGIKPNIFEIFKDGELVDQTAVLDYQDYLDEKVIKRSYRTFLQTSILSVENYTPFMSLPKAGRREFIEDILDIGVFSTMNKLIKAKFSKNKETLNLLTVQYRSLKEKLVLQKSHIDQLEENKKVGMESLDIKLVEYQSEIDSHDDLFAGNDAIVVAIEAERDNLNGMIKNQREINNKIISLRNRIATSEKDIKFFEINDDCPSCRQGITEDHVHSIVDSQKAANKTLQDEVDALIQANELNSGTDALVTSLSKRENAQNTLISVANSTIRRLNGLIKEVNREKSALMVVDDILSQRESMSKDAKQAMEFRDQQLVLTEEQTYNTLMLELFKDSGIKSKIVEQYIPLINKLSNEYLDQLDFFVSFELDSEFSETIKSRHRDDFTYDSFSAGEKQRIDVALMFTFRKLAKIRNSFSSNLMLLDELLDASLDSDGVDLLMNILDGKEFADTNIMVISHANKDLFEDRFDGSYRVFKRDGFTQIE